MPYLHPRERTARNLLRGGLVSGAALIFIPAITFLLIIFETPVTTLEEEDAVENIAFITWIGLTILFLLSTIALLLSSFIAYRRLLKELQSTI